MGKIVLLQGDAVSLDLEDESVDLIITHPPYFGVDTKRYGGVESQQINSSRNRKKMLKLLNKATKEMYRVLKPTGSLIIANGPNENIDVRFFIDTIDNTGFKYVDHIIQNSYNEKLSGLEMIAKTTLTWYHFSKTDRLYFNPFKVRDYNNPVWNFRDENMDDEVDQKMSQEFFVLDAMNKQIPKRFIEMFSKPGQVVFDPFGGSALVAVTAVELGRVGISNDISEYQTRSAKERIRLTLGEDCSIHNSP